MIFQSLGDMLEFNGTEMYGIAWEFESYYREADIDEEEGTTSRCYLVKPLLGETSRH